MNLPPYIQASDKVILFDGVCKLCNAWSNFIIKHDKKHYFKLCSVQSPEGQAILAHFNLPTTSFESMLYVEKGEFYQKSEAFLKIVRLLGFPWNMASIFKLIPRIINDYLYDRVALNRYRLFGRYDVCTLALPDHDNRYLK